MTIYNKQTNKVELTSTILNSALLNPSLYSAISLKIKLVGGTYIITDLKTSSNFTVDSTKVYLNSILFGQLTSTVLIPDGVYELVFITTASGIVQTEQVCTFVDNLIPCTLITDEQKLTYLMFKESYNCTCDCTELNNIYTTLIQNDTTNCNC